MGEKRREVELRPNVSSERPHVARVRLSVGGEQVVGWSDWSEDVDSELDRPFEDFVEACRRFTEQLPRSASALLVVQVLEVSLQVLTNRRPPQRVKVDVEAFGQTLDPATAGKVRSPLKPESMALPVSVRTVTPTTELSMRNRRSVHRRPW